MRWALHTLRDSLADQNSALFTFFITYILFEVPSNILLKKVRPSIFLSSIIGVWGCITIGMGCTTSFSGLVACRVLIGFFEAGFFPGCIYLISMCRLSMIGVFGVSY